MAVVDQAQRPDSGESTETRASGVVALYAFVILGVLIPFQVADLSVLARTETSALLAMVLVLLAATRLSTILAAGVPRLLTFMFWVYVYIWLGLGSLAQITGERFPIASDVPYDGGAQSATVIVVLVGALAFELGRKLRQPEGGAIARMLDRPIDAGRVKVLALVSLPVATAIAVSVGGLKTLLAPREVATLRLLGVPPSGANFHLIHDKTSGVIKTVALTIPVFLALYLFIHLHKSGRKERAGLVAALVVANILVNNPISNPRLWFGTVSLCLAVAFVPVDRPARFRLGGAALIGLILVVFPYADAFRQNTRFRIETRPLGDQLRTNPDYDSFQMILTTRQWVNDEGHALGRQALGAALFWVPRSFWEGKPRDTSQVVAEHEAFRYTNVSCPLWAETYADGGLGWVAVLFTGYGWLVATLEAAFARGRRWTTMGWVLVPVLAAYELLLLRGALLPAMARLVMLVGLVALTTRRREQAASMLASQE